MAEFRDCFWTVRVEISGVESNKSDRIFINVSGIFKLSGKSLESKVC